MVSRSNGTEHGCDARMTETRERTHFLNELFLRLHRSVEPGAQCRVPRLCSGTMVAASQDGFLEAIVVIILFHPWEQPGPLRGSSKVLGQKSEAVRISASSRSTRILAFTPRSRSSPTGLTRLFFSFRFLAHFWVAFTIALAAVHGAETDGIGVAVAAAPGTTTGSSRNSLRSSSGTS